jgi:hypothetical protein
MRISIRQPGLLETIAERCGLKYDRRSIFDWSIAAFTPFSAEKTVFTTTRLLIVGADNTPTSLRLDMSNLSTFDCIARRQASIAPTVSK